MSSDFAEQRNGVAIFGEDIYGREQEVGTVIASRLATDIDQVHIKLSERSLHLDGWSGEFTTGGSKYGEWG